MWIPFDSMKCDITYPWVPAACVYPETPGSFRAVSTVSVVRSFYRTPRDVKFLHVDWLPVWRGNFCSWTFKKIEVLEAFLALYKNIKKNNIISTLAHFIIFLKCWHFAAFTWSFKINSNIPHAVQDLYVPLFHFFVNLQSQPLSRM